MTKTDILIITYVSFDEVSLKSDVKAVISHLVVS